MQKPHDDILAGRPASNTPASPAPADAAAWRQALHTSGPQAAAAGARGPFAIGLQEEDGRAFLAVDRFAQQTLCYTVRDGRLAFATDARHLVGPSPALDLQALYDYLFFHAIPSPRTIFEGVHRLPAAHMATFADGHLDVRPYWTPTFEPPRQPPSFDQAKEEFRALLQQSVKDRLDGGKPGCFLSGGTDSSTVSGMVGLAAGRAAATYSIGFEAAGYDEMAFARIAAKHFGTEHHEYYVTPQDLVRSVHDVAAWYDQPFGNSSALPAYYCARMARENGVTRILAGDGGDELFGGNTRYAKQRVFDAYGHVPAVLRRGVLEPLLGHRGESSVPPVRKAASYIEQARLPMPQRTHLYNLLLRLGVNEVLEPGFVASVDLAGPGRQQQAVWDSARASSQLDKSLAYDWRYTLAESDLPKVRGTTSMAGLEVGYPMLDERLVDFSMRLPPAWKLKGFQLRWFFKEALRGFLPDEIITKKKQGFGLPFGVWALQDAALNQLATDALDSLATRGIVRPAFIRTLCDRLLAEHPGYYGEMVWILMMMEHWLRAHAPQFSVAR